MLYIEERESVAIVLIGHLRASNNQEVTTNECRKHQKGCGVGKGAWIYYLRAMTVIVILVCMDGCTECHKIV